MSELIVEVTGEGEGVYRGVLKSFSGQVTRRLLLVDATDVSDGELSDDEPTAVATFTFLLGHQDAGDLPERIEIADVVAAYDDAVEQIVASRQGS